MRPSSAETSPDNSMTKDTTMQRILQSAPIIAGAFTPLLAFVKNTLDDSDVGSADIFYTCPESGTEIPLADIITAAEMILRSFGVKEEFLE